MALTKEEIGLRAPGTNSAVEKSTAGKRRTWPIRGFVVATFGWPGEDGHEALERNDASWPKWRERGREKRRARVESGDGLRGLEPWSGARRWEKERRKEARNFKRGRTKLSRLLVRKTRAGGGAKGKQRRGGKTGPRPTETGRRAREDEERRVALLSALARSHEFKGRIKSGKNGGGRHLGGNNIASTRSRSGEVERSGGNRAEGRKAARRGGEEGGARMADLEGKIGGRESRKRIRVGKGSANRGRRKLATPSESRAVRSEAPFRPEQSSVPKAICPGYSRATYTYVNPTDRQKKALGSLRLSNEVNSGRRPWEENKPGIPWQRNRERGS
ncbi:hypothetical protein KM043_006623 [Ampulex compressa]|nr:hypothetical protein KM043_006623 [Ampulex compressa]